MEYDENIPKLENVDNTEIDSLLQNLVLLTDLSDIDSGITIQVASNFISGRVISKKEYLAQNVNALKEIAKSSTSGSLDFLQKLFADKTQEEEKWVSSAVNENFAEETNLKRKPEALHLRNARLYSFSSIESFEIPLLRVKLSSVDSFFLGEFV